MMDIKHAHLYGSRSVKYEWFLSHDVLSTDWQSLQPQSPFYLFIPQNTDLLGEYEQGWKITDIMPVNVLGFQTHRDYFAADFDREKLEQRIVEMRGEGISDNEYVKKYRISDNRDWKIREARQKIRNDINWDKPSIDCAYSFSAQDGL